MKKKFDMDIVRTVVVAIVMGVAAFSGAINDRNREKKIDELIEKVSQLEGKES